MIGQMRTEAVVLLRGLAATRPTRIRLAKRLATEVDCSIIRSFMLHIRALNESFSDFATSHSYQRGHLVKRSIGLHCTSRSSRHADMAA